VFDASIRSSSPDERHATLALTFVPDVGRVAYDNLIATFCNAVHALHAGVSPSVANEAYARADLSITRAAARGLELVTEMDADYPIALRDLQDPPAILWRRGSLDVLRDPIIAVVGTRRATPYGQRMTREIVGALARGGATIVSGMALGIDATAHKAALDVGGRTVAVLGTGADVAYPRGHVALHREIGARGLVLSELPPGARSNRGSFPKRNRIIAGLARLTIVVEAPVLSGALITARDANELGRDVAAVPGPIDSPQSQGTNEYIRDGAHPITCVADALMLAGLTPQRRAAPAMDDETELRIWSALGDGAATLDELCARSALPVTQCLTAVTRLELRGAVECALTGEIRRR
jgi:DNA processing protein